MSDKDKFNSLAFFHVDFSQVYGSSESDIVEASDEIFENASAMAELLRKYFSEYLGLNIEGVQLKLTETKRTTDFKREGLHLLINDMSEEDLAEAIEARSEEREALNNDKYLLYNTEFNIDSAGYNEVVSATLEQLPEVAKSTLLRRIEGDFLTFSFKNSVKDVREQLDYLEELMCEPALATADITDLLVDTVATVTDLFAVYQLYIHQAQQEADVESEY